MDYLPWEHDRNDDALAYIEDLPASIDDDSFRIKEEKSIAGWWPEEVVLDLSLDYGGIKLSDSIPNAVGVHIVSEKLKGILEEACGETIDFYPVTIRNQKGRLVKKPYYLAHLRLVIGAMDWDKSDATVNAIHPECAGRIRRLVLDEKKIPENTKLFALKEKAKIWLISRELAVKIYREHDCRGMIFIKLADYGKMWR